MSQEISAFVEQLITIIVMAVVITTASILLYIGIGYYNGTYEYVDNKSTHIRDTSFQTKYQKFVANKELYPVPAIVHEFNTLDSVSYQLRLKQSNGSYTSLGTIDKSQMQDYYHLKAIVKSTSNQHSVTSHVTIVLDME